MKKGDKITMYFDCMGVTSEEQVTIKEVTDKEVITEDYYDTEDGEENFRFDIKTGKCLNQRDFGFGGKRRIKKHRTDMNVKQKILNRIETNEECIGNFSLTEPHKESIKSENRFLQELLNDL